MRRALETELLALRDGGGAAQALVKFRASRTKLGISVDQVARASGVNQGRIARLESGDTTAHPDEVLALMSSLFALAEIMGRFPLSGDGKEPGPNGPGPPR